MQSTHAHHDPAILGRPRAFTLIETIVAIGAMALVAVGIAAIFQTVGRTISGGKRISALNAQAAMIENQMRRDFESITRDGFFVIRNSYADVNDDGQFNLTANPTDNPDAVALDVLDMRKRPRRVDEILFFAQGDFASSREPLNPNYVAKSNAARIYYGHGARRPALDASGQSDPSYLIPEITEDNRVAETGRLGGPDMGTVINPNRYAAGWTLLRHEALLIKPDTSLQALPAEMVFNLSPTSQRARLEDKYGQIALQPAAWSLFRTINRELGAMVPPARYIRAPGQSDQPRNFRPAISSGIVDIVNSDLNDVRAVVTAMGRLPGAVTNPALCVPAGNLPTGTPLQVQPRINQARAWMDEAFPTNSDPSNAAADAGSRMRYEPGPPGYVGAIATGTDTVLKTIRRVDQLALSASNFVAGCTEFIVEWSFGDSDSATTAGSQEIIWHGLARPVDSDGNGLLETADRVAALPYPYYQRPGASGNVIQSRVVLQYPNATGGTYDYQVRDGNTGLINRPLESTISETSYFGYIDPLINPATVNPVDGYVPWPWPKLVRITMTLTDPANPTSEETFQFVFSVGKPSL